MDGYYEVTLGNSAVGKVQLIRQGLYYRVICHCRIPSDRVYRLYGHMADKRENLGVLVPEGDGFLLDKRIPVKRLDLHSVRFFVSDGKEPVTGGRFVPICPEEPFTYIEQLKTAFLESEQGKIGIRIKEHPEAG